MKPTIYRLRDTIRSKIFNYKDFQDQNTELWSAMGALLPSAVYFLNPSSVYVFHIHRRYMGGGRGYFFEKVPP